MHKGKTIDSIDNYEIMDCDTCGFIHLNPIPSNEILEEFYKENYFTNHKPNYIKTDFEENQFQRIAFSERERIFKKKTPGKSILDIGCGTGVFLNFLKAKGWKTYGVEPSIVAGEIAKKKGNNIFIGDVSQFKKINNEKFDIVSLKNVLEHVDNPNKVLDYAISFLNENGLLFIEVPNDYSFIQKLGVKILGSHKNWISAPDHINYFNFKSLRKLLEKKELRIYYRFTSFPMYLFQFLGFNFSKSKKKGKKLHKMRIKFEINIQKIKIIKIFLYKFLSFLNLGRTVIYYCELKK